MPAQVAAAVKVARRAWPLALAAYRRWDRLPEHEKERYRKQVRNAAKRGRAVAGGAVDRARRRKRR